MFKSSALAAFLFLSKADAEGIKITSRSLARNEFVKKMRNSQKKHGKISRQLSFDAFINKSVHKPGLRTKKETMSHADAETDAGRKLNWWQWGGDSEEGAVEDADVDANQYYAASGNTYYDGNNAYANGDDMWGYEEDKEYVVESLRDFSLKYAGCAATTSFSESEGEDGAYAFQNNNFVTYRLCPTESCNDNSWNGCKSTYGEYMMSLEDFLITQQDYVDLEFNAYCDFCKDCVYFTEFYANGGNTKNNNGQGSCKYYEDCKDYGDSCDENAQAGEQKMEGDFDYEDFFECKEIDLSYYGYNSNSWSQNGNEDSNTVYAGPHCKEGTIQIGLFSDENCYNYIGNKYVNLDLSNFEYDALASVEELYVPEGCMSCDLADTMEDGQQSWLSMYLSNSEEEGEQNPEEEYSGLTLICANLYMQSAKCNSHLMNYDNYEDSALQLSDNEYYSQTETCSFIENVMQGHISEQGWVGSAGQVTPWSSLTNMFGNPYTERVTAGQGVMLAASIMGSAYLGYMAFTLRNKLNSGDMQDDLIPAYDKELS
jgi:hypothetical protein